MDRSPRTTVILTGLWIGAFVGLAGYSSDAIGRYPFDGTPIDGHLLYVATYVFTAAICLMRFATVPRERLIWGLFGVGMLGSGLGWAYYYLVLSHQARPPYPSPADGLWLSFYATSFVALMLMLRKRVHRFSNSLWLDAATGALALAAVAAAVLVEPIVASTDNDTAAIAMSAAYPLADVLVLAVVVGMFALSRWRPERRWVMIGVAFGVQVVVDTYFLRAVATGSWEYGSLLDVPWVLVNLLVACAAWQDTQGRALRFEGWQVLGVPIAFSAIAIGVLIYGNFSQLHPASLTLAILALAGSLAAAGNAYVEQRKLEVLAGRDALTGLDNYREYHRRLDELLTAAERSGQKFAIVLIDVDGFKNVNDLRGHAEGDRRHTGSVRAATLGRRALSR